VLLLAVFAHLLGMSVIAAPSKSPFVLILQSSSEIHHRRLD